MTPPHGAAGRTPPPPPDGAAPRARNNTAYIRWHAKRRPDAIAVRHGEHCVCYARMASDLARVVGALALPWAGATGMAALFHPQLYPRLLLTLALEELGITVVQFQPDELPTIAALAGLHRILMPDAADHGIGDRLLRVDQDWWREVVTRSPGNVRTRPARAGDVLLLLRSSGTSGPPKRMPATRAMLDIRIGQRARALRLGATAQCLATMPLGVAGTYYAAIACLRLGATVVQPSTPPWEDARITHLTVLPMQLRCILQALPREAIRLERLTVCVIGARLAPILRRAALDRWCGTVVSVYSSNEAGTVAMVGADGIAAIAPDIEVGIDNQGGGQDEGDSGFLRVRGPGVVSGYLPPGTGRAAFEDGWFITGDLGRLMPGGRLQLLGRRDDVVNLCGIKRACEDIEDGLLQQTGLAEVAVFTREDELAGQILVVCAIAVPGQTLRDVLQTCLRMSGVPVSLWFLDALPRTEHGKLRRSLLREHVDNTMNAHGCTTLPCTDPDPPPFVPAGDDPP